MNRSRYIPQNRRNRPRVELLEGRQLLATFSVTSVADSGPGTFRDAIVQANALSGVDTIAFAIPGAGVRTIVPTSPLPSVTDPAVIDATSQTGYAGTPLIELNGSNILDGATPPAPIANVNGLTLAAGASTVRGFAINRFTGFGISAAGDGNTIAANFVGTDSAGLISLRNFGGGISVTSRNNTIGGSAAGDRNVISGNGGAGLLLGGPGNQQVANNQVIGNLIGTDVNGTGDLGNTGPGVSAQSAGNRVGGSARNVIAFNGSAGVQVGSIGGSQFFAANTITANSIFSNSDQGIEIVTFFSTGNIPDLTSAALVPGGTQVEGSLSTFIPNATYTIEFFSNTTTDATGFGEGQTFRGSATVTTNAQGVANFTSLLPVALPVGQFVTATATDSAGSTFEFSRALAVGTTAQADLAISGSTSSFQGRTGQPLTYFFNVRNNGPSRSLNTIVISTLPQGATFVSASSSQGSVPIEAVAGRVVFGLGSLNSGQGVQLTLTVMPTQTGTATNVAVVTDPLDSDAGNNESTIFTQILATPPADLAILGASSPNPVAIGTELTYLFVVQNTSFQAGSTGVVVTDILPPGLTFLRARSSQGTVTEVNGTVVANLGTIPAAANATVTIIVRPTAAGLISNAASVRSNESDPDSTNNDVVVNTFVNAAPPADLAVAITAAPQPAQVGRDFTYAVLVGNNGPAFATNVVLRDFLPDGVSIVSITPSQGTASTDGGIVTARLGSLPAGAVAVVTIVLRPGAPGTFESRADVAADQPDFKIADNVSFLTVAVVGDSAPPQLAGQKLIVTRKAITGIVLTFSQALDPRLANDVANYAIRDLGRNAKLAAKDGREVAIKSATYDSASRSILLVPSKPLKLKTFYKLVVNGPGAPGVVNVGGVVLDGDRNGLPDGIYESLIGRGTHDRPRPLQLGATRPRPRPVKVVKAPKADRPTKTTTVIVNN